MGVGPDCLLLGLLSFSSFLSNKPNPCGGRFGAGGTDTSSDFFDKKCSSIIFFASAGLEGARAREYDAAIHWLLDARLIYRSQHIAAPKLPLPAYGDNRAFKLYMIDVGLLGAIAQLESRVILQGNELFTEFKGALTENYVACNLARLADNKLYYWTSGNTAEVDFITHYHAQLYPLEVKSGSSNKKKSLQVYDERYHPELLYRISPMNLRQDGRICNYPLYLIERYPYIEKI